MASATTGAAEGAFAACRTHTSVEGMTAGHAQQPAGALRVATRAEAAL